MQANSAGRLHDYELMHGLIRFEGEDVRFLVGGIPQLITIAELSNVRLDLSWQLHGSQRRRRVDLAYSVDGGPLRSTRVRRRGDAPRRYESGMLSLSIGGGTPGLHEVEFFLQVDGTTISVPGVRYLAALVVVELGEIPRTYYGELSEPGRWREVSSRRSGPTLADRMQPDRVRRREESEALAQEVASLRRSVSRMPDLMSELMVLQRDAQAEIDKLAARRPGDGNGLLPPALESAARVGTADRGAAAYGVAGVGAAVDPVLTRARAIEDHLGRLVGRRVLVIGSAFGYLPMYLAERGAEATGWEFDPGCAAVARHVAGLTGSTAVLSHVTNIDTRLEALESSVFDIAILDPTVPPDVSGRSALADAAGRAGARASSTTTAPAAAGGPVDGTVRRSSGVSRRAPSVDKRSARRRGVAEDGVRQRPRLSPTTGSPPSRTSGRPWLGRTGRGATTSTPTTS